MTVGELLKLLERRASDSLVVINGKSPEGIELLRGKIKDGYFGPVFEENPKGKQQAIAFIHSTELSTGEIVQTTVW